MKLNVVGHDQAWSRLQKMRASSMIFSGPEGVGKFHTAMSWIQSLLCENGNHCGTCGSCIRMHQGQHENVKIVKPDGQNIKIAQIHELIGFIRLKSEASHRFVVIDDADTLNAQSSNALLKSLEEPPAGVQFILITSKPHSLLSTIRSRCQTLNFGGLTEENLRTLNPNLPEWVIKASQGRYSVCEKLNSEEWGEIKRETLGLIKTLVDTNQEVSVDQWQDREHSSQMISATQWLLRDIYLFLNNSDECIHQDLLPEYEGFRNVPPDMIMHIFNEFCRLEKDFQGNKDRKMGVETLSIQLNKEVTDRGGPWLG